eukprot:gene11800-15789_t
MTHVARELIKVYGAVRSGNSQKIFLACSLMGINYEPIIITDLFGIEWPGGAKSEEYLKINPTGLVPSIIDPNNKDFGDHLYHPDGIIIHDSAAILTYLAMQYARNWLPLDNPERLSKINYWLCFAANEINNSLRKMRIFNVFNFDIFPMTYEYSLEKSRATLGTINSSLAGNYAKNSFWIVTGNDPTVADIAIFPYVAFAEHSSNGEIQLKDYPEICDWLARFKQLPGYVSPPDI